VKELSKEYIEYINSEKWREKRQIIAQRDNYTCRYCGKKTKNFDVHHLTYAHLFDEPLDDLVLVCRNCHLILEKDKEIRKELEQVIVKEPPKVEISYKQIKKAKKHCYDCLFAKFNDLGNGKIEITCGQTGVKSTKNRKVCSQYRKDKEFKYRELAFKSKCAIDGIEVKGKFVCPSCNSDTSYVKFHKTNVGVYCINCNKYIKFLNKKERKSLQILNKK